MLVLASAAVICAAVPLSVTELLPLAPPTMVTPVVVSTLILPCDTVSTVCSRSAVFGPSDTEIPLSESAVFSLTASVEVGTVSDTVVVSATWIATVFVAEVALLTVSVVVTDRLSGP